MPLDLGREFEKAMAASEKLHNKRQVAAANNRELEQAAIQAFIETMSPDEKRQIEASAKNKSKKNVKKQPKALQEFNKRLDDQIAENSRVASKNKESPSPIYQTLLPPDSKDLANFKAYQKSKQGQSLNAADYLGQDPSRRSIHETPTASISRQVSAEETLAAEARFEAWKAEKALKEEPTYTTAASVASSTISRAPKQNDLPPPPPSSPRPSERNGASRTREERSDRILGGRRPALKRRRDDDAGPTQPSTSSLSRKGSATQEEAMKALANLQKHIANTGSPSRIPSLKRPEMQNSLNNGSMRRGGGGRGGPGGP